MTFNEEAFRRALNSQVGDKTGYNVWNGQWPELAHMPLAAMRDLIKAYFKEVGE